MSRTLITIGGIGTIFAVALVFVFLLWVAVPLFFPASVEDENHIALNERWQAPIHLGVDDYLKMAWALYPDGKLTVYRIETGQVLSSTELFEGRTITAFSAVPGTPILAVGFSDGSVEVGSIAFKARYLDPAAETSSLGEIKVGDSVPRAGGLVTRTPAGQLRVDEVSTDFGEPMDLGTGEPIKLIGHAPTPAGPIIAAWSESGGLRMAQVRSRKNMLTGKITSSLRKLKLEYEPPTDGPPTQLMVSGLGASILLAWPDGKALEFLTHSFTSPDPPRSFDLVDPENAHLTGLSPILGAVTFIVADDQGRADAWFPTRDEEEGSGEPKLVRARTLPRAGGAILSVAPSSRSRVLALADSEGGIQVVHVTSNKLLASLKIEAPSTGIDNPIAMIFAPKDDGLVALSPAGLWKWTFDLRYPEASFASLFRPVWYEGYSKPEYVWQSSSGTDDFEPKLSLIPLIFGTLKATFYSALFGVPLALLAAIATSEFLARRWRTQVKTVVEMMAALPSVVLGFLAALVFAPYADRWLPAILAGLVTLPVAILFGACLWQFFPRPVYLRLSRLRSFGVLLSMLAGIALAFVVGPFFQKILFAGDIKLWLDGGRGGALGGWALLFYPLIALIVGAIVGMRIRPILAQNFPHFSRFRLAVLDFVIFLASMGVVFLLVLALGEALSRAGLDPRGNLLGTYVQRNALVVGFVMGFAIIPIIYTIAEDAFASVPDHLRSASLAAGATQWQTVSRVVLPTAMSGVFSAIMIGLGRAVGETMIVLMAAGNTPVLEWNIFNGFRTLSANLAVELPEAVRGSTHYRTLFLAALVLFSMTFLLNSLAEVVRRRFQKRSHQL